MKFEIANLLYVLGAIVTVGSILRSVSKLFSYLTKFSLVAFLRKGIVNFRRTDFYFLLGYNNHIFRKFLRLNALFTVVYTVLMVGIHFVYYIMTRIEYYDIILIAYLIINLFFLILYPLFTTIILSKLKFDRKLIIKGTVSRALVFFIGSYLAIGISYMYITVVFYKDLIDIFFIIIPVIFLIVSSIYYYNNYWNSIFTNRPKKKKEYLIKVGKKKID